MKARMILVVVFVAVAIAGALFWQQSQPKPEEKVTIEFYSEYAGLMPAIEIEGVDEPGDWGEYVAELYEKENPHVGIVSSVAVYSGGGSEQLSVRLAAGKYPTVYAGFSGRLFTYAPMFLELPKPNVPFFAGALDQVAYPDKTLAYPIEFRGALPVINVTLVEDAGCEVPDSVQWTTNEAAVLAKCLAESGKGHLMIFFTQKLSGHNIQWQWLSGGARLFEGGDYSRCTFNNDYATDYLEWEKSLLPYLPGNPSQYDILEWLNQFTIGKVALGFGGWELRVKAAYKDGKIDKPQEFKSINWPHLPSVNGGPLAREVAKSVAIFEPAVRGNEQLKEEAIKFVNWLTGPGPNFAYHYGFSGSRLDTEMALGPGAEEVQQTFGSWGPGFASGAFNEGRGIWSEEMYEFWSGGKSAKEAMESFVERYAQAIADLQ